MRVAVKTREESPFPAQPPAAGEKPSAPPAEPVLEGIWVDANLRVAFISGQALAAGEKVLGWTVVSITREKVVLQKGPASKNLRLEAR